MQTFEWSCYVPVPVERVWSFFADPENLPLLTPSAVRLEVTGKSDTPPRAGTLVAIRLRLLGIPLRWHSVIESWEPGRGFNDLQLRGPCRFWRHEHRFRPAGRGTWIVDRVEYALPLGAAGRFVERWFMRGILRRLFRFRSAAAARWLQDGPPASARAVPEWAASA
jgi:ligand-binding SRPBCC domain-containing protein